MSLIWCDRSMPLPKTSPDMSPTPRTVKGVRLDIDIRFAEMPLHGLPGAARGDAHLLVVIARRAARREGIAEPEMIVFRKCIGDVGEGRRALVGGDHQIGIIAVAPHGIGRRFDACRRAHCR